MLVNMGIPPLAKKNYVYYSKREMYTIVSYDGGCKKKFHQRLTLFCCNK